MAKSNGADGDGVFELLGRVIQATLLLWIAFAFAIPVALVALQVMGDLVGISTSHWDFAATVFQPSVFVAAFLSAIVVVYWDMSVRALCREKEIKRRHFLIRFLELEHGLSLSDERKQEIYAALDTEIN